VIELRTVADKIAAENEIPIEARWTARTLYEQLGETAAAFPDRPGIVFQLKSDPDDRAATLTWSQVLGEVTQAANLFRDLGIGPTDVVSYVLPNCLEAPLVLLAGATAGIVSPVNPLLTPEVMGSILRETRSKVVVTLAPFPRTTLAQTVDEAVERAPEVRAIVQVDLARYLSKAQALMVLLMRPRRASPRHKARTLDYRKETASRPADRLSFEESKDNRVCAYFHTGGTTGLPKVAQHRASGILYNGWCGRALMFTEQDVLMCPLPMFHVLAAYPVFMSCLTSGASIVFPTPQGYRGHGVIQKFWKLIERHKVTFVITVPTAASALMQREPDAEVSTLRLAISGSAAMPQELFNRFEKATGVKILEGYGMTEATCLVSINPPFGERKIGSVGVPFPYTDVRILQCDVDGRVVRSCDIEEVGEICVKNPGVSAAIYTETERNRGVLTPEGYLRTGDLGRLDADGYLWITGRAKDLIIRGGHNIDPAIIEEVLIQHPDVAFAGAVGQPDSHSGEVPAVYVELVEGARVDESALSQHLSAGISERAALPKHVEILRELPKTAVGKVYKPDLRRLAITRVFDRALEAKGLDARVAEVVDDRKRGLVAVLAPRGDTDMDRRVGEVLGDFVTPWQWQD